MRKRSIYITFELVGTWFKPLQIALGDIMSRSMMTNSLGIILVSKKENCTITCGLCCFSDNVLNLIIFMLSISDTP